MKPTATQPAAPRTAFQTAGSSVAIRRALADLEDLREMTGWPADRALAYYLRQDRARLLTWAERSALAEALGQGLAQGEPLEAKLGNRDLNLAVERAARAALARSSAEEIGLEEALALELERSLLGPAGRAELRRILRLEPAA